MKSLRSKIITVTACVAAAVAIVLTLVLTIGNVAKTCSGDGDISSVPVKPLHSAKTDAEWEAEGYIALTEQLVASGYGNEPYQNTPGVLRTIWRYNSDTNEMLDTGNKFYLKSDVVTPYTVIFRGNTYIHDTSEETKTAHAVLDLNGHKLVHGGTFGAAVAVMGQVELTIKDSAPTVKYSYIDDHPVLYTTNNAATTSDFTDRRYYVQDVTNEAGKCITGGVITGGKRHSIAVKGIADPERNAQFTVITDDVDRVAESSHGGVYITNGGKVTLEGGNIIGNYTQDVDGGGVSVNASQYYTLEYSQNTKVLRSEFTMTGGTVCGNLALGANGGGIAADRGASVTVLGGEVFGNRSVAKAEDVDRAKAEYEQHKVLSSDTPDIDINSGMGGGIFADNVPLFGVAMVKQYGSTDDYTYSPLDADASVTVGGSALIRDNYAQIAGGGAYLSGGYVGEGVDAKYQISSMEMTGGEIIRNQAETTGGGIAFGGRDGSLKLSRAPRVTQNVQITARDDDGKAAAYKESNVLLRYYYVIWDKDSYVLRYQTIGGELSTGAEIGITQYKYWGSGRLAYDKGEPIAPIAHTLSAQSAGYVFADDETRTVSTFDGAAYKFRAYDEASAGWRDFTFDVGGGHCLVATETNYAASVVINGLTDNAQSYATLVEAFTSAQDGLSGNAEITLLRDIRLTDSITVDKTVTLDLNGHTVTMVRDGAPAFIVSDNSFTVTDGNKSAKHYYEKDARKKAYRFTSRVTDNYVLGGVITGADTADDFMTAVSDREKAGGAIRVLLPSGRSDTVKLILAGGNISGNRAFTGGGVYACNAVVEQSDCAVVGNYANSYGGGISVYNSRATYNQKVILSGGAIKDNCAEKDGGGACFALIEGAPALIGGVEITGNTAGNYGGGIHILSGKIELSDINVHHNQAQLGGGIYLSGEKADVTFTGHNTNTEYKDIELISNVYRNSAEEGGGIYFSGGKLTMSSGVISNNNGGGLTLDGVYGGAATQEDVSCLFNISGNPVIDNNYTADRSNALDVHIKRDISSNAHPVINIAGDLTTTGVQYTYMYLGVIHIDGDVGAGKIVTSGLGDRTFKCFSVGHFGDTASPKLCSFRKGRTGEMEMYRSDYVAAISDKSGFEHGYTTIAAALDEAKARVDGGKTEVKLSLAKDVALAETLILSTDMILDLNGYTLSLAADGGSVINAQAAITAVDGYGGGAISSGKGTNGYGGGVHVSSGASFTLDGAEISGNTATYGGGVYVSDGGMFTMSSGKITANTAIQGGGVYSASDDGGRADDMIGGDRYVKIAGGEISNNTAEVGGGMYIGYMMSDDTAGYNYAGGGALLTGGEIKNNTALQKGGGVYVRGYLAVKGAPVVVGNTANGGANNIQLDETRRENANGVCDGDVSDIVAIINIVGALDNSARLGIYNTNRTGNNNVSSVPPHRFAHTSGLYPIPDFTAYFTADSETDQVQTSGNYGVLAAVAVSVTVGERVTGYTDFASAAAAVGSEQSALKLLKDVTVDTTFTVASGKNIILDLNGHIFALKAGENVPVIDVIGELTVIDSDENAEHSYKTEANEAHYPYTKTRYVIGQGSEVIRGGVITSSGRSLTGTADGSGVVVSGGTFTLAGGNISGNAVNNKEGGGGVTVLSGTFNMTGGSIEGNCADYGGGVNIKGGTFNMSGGEIKRNEAYYRGGGVHIQGGAFNMTGGKIEGNRINCYASGSFSDSKILGGGVCLYLGSASLTGGEIAENQITAKDENGTDLATRLGGGVYYGDQNQTSLTLGGTIKITTSATVLSKASNLLYISGSRIVNTTEFNSGASVLIYVDGSKTVTNGYGENNPSLTADAVFVAHEQTYTPILSAGEVAFVTANDKFIVSSDLGITYYSDLKDAFSYVSNTAAVTAATVTLGDDHTENHYNQSGALASFTGKAVTVDLNGHNIFYQVSMNNEYSPNVFAVRSGAKLTLTGGGTIGYGGILVYGSGELVIDGVTIDGNDAGGDAYKANPLVELQTADGAEPKATLKSGVIQSGYGYGVSLRGGTFTVLDGEIKNNGGGYNFSAQSYNKSGYGGVYILDGTFDMQGGAIYGNKGGEGGGVYLDRGTFKMSGEAAVYDNKKVTRQGTNETSVNNNVYLKQNTFITVGALIRGAKKIGVTLETGKGKITSGFALNNGNANPADYFTAENAASGTTLRLKGGEAAVSGNSIATVIIGSTETEYDTFDAARTAADGASGAVTLRLEADVQPSSTWTIAAGKDITLDLNGCMYKYYKNDSNDYRAIIVCGRFTLTDSGQSAVHKYTVNSAGRYVFGSSGEVLTGGVLTRAENGKNYAGGIKVDGGTFVMTGGNIAGNDVYFDTFDGTYNNIGGAVFVSSGTANISGGKICGNNEGGVSVKGGTLNLSGTAQIVNNKTSVGGAGVYIRGGSFTMTGGEISGNTASSYGGGVAAIADATVTLGGGKISGNVANNGGGVYATADVTLSGSVISGNIMSKYGGGVYVGSGKTLTMTSGEITGNTASTYGSAVYLVGNSVLDVSGGEIKGNKGSDPVYVQAGSIKVSGAPKMYDTYGFDSFIANKTLIVSGRLTDGAHIVTRYTSVITSGYKDKNGSDDPAAYFAHTSSNRAFILSDSGEVTTMIANWRLQYNQTVFSYTKYFENLEDAINAAIGKENNGITMLANTKVDHAFTVNAFDGTIRLDLNGFKLELTKDISEPLFTVVDGTELVINDSDPTKRNTYNASDPVVVYGGVIDGGGYLSGGCVYAKGTFKMTGGNIVNFHTKEEGAAGGISIFEDEMFKGTVTLSGTARVFANYENRGKKEHNVNVSKGSLNVFALDATDEKQYIGVTVSTGGTGSFVATCYAQYNEAPVKTYFRADAAAALGLCDIVHTTGDKYKIEKHTLGTPTVITAPTCTAAGSGTVVCSVCGKSETVQIAKLEHEWGEWSTTAQPTCTAQGTQKSSCSLCGQERTQSLDKIDHSYGEWTVQKQATCDEDGQKTRICSACGDTQTETIAKLGHDYGEWTEQKQATCDEGGTEIHICKRDGSHTETRATSALGHDYGEWTEQKQATCTDGGSELRVCKRDGEHTETRATAALGHDDGRWVITVAATEEATGLRELQCTRCDYVLDTEVIPKRDPSLDGYNAIMDDPALSAAFDCKFSEFDKNKLAVIKRLIDEYEKLNDANKQAFTSTQRNKISTLKEWVQHVTDTENALSEIQNVTVDNNIRPNDARRALENKLNTIERLVEYLTDNSQYQTGDLAGYDNYTKAKKMAVDYYETQDEAEAALYALRGFIASGIVSGAYTRAEFAAALDRAQKAVTAAVAAGNDADEFIDYNLIDKTHPNNKYKELDGYDSYIKIKTDYADILTMDPDKITALNVDDVSAMVKAYEALPYNIRNLFSGEEKTKISNLDNMADKIKRYADSAVKNLTELAEVTAQKLAEDRGYSYTVNSSLSSAKNALASYVGANVTTAESDIEGVEHIARVTQLLADYDVYYDFYEDYSVELSVDFSSSRIDDYLEMYERYTALTDGQKQFLNEHYQAKIEELKTAADKYKESERKAQDALNDLAITVENADISFAELRTAYMDAKNACDKYDELGGHTFFLQNSSALDAAEQKLEQLYADEIEKRINDIEIAAFTPEHIASLTDEQLSAADKKVDELIELIEEAPLRIQFEYDDELNDLKDIAGKIEDEKTKRKPDEPDTPVTPVDPNTPVTPEPPSSPDGEGGEPVHGGWLAIDLILAVILIAEVLYLVFHKRFMPAVVQKLNSRRTAKTEKTAEQSHESSEADVKPEKGDNNDGALAIAPVFLLGAVHAGGWAAGVTFFVLLLLAVIIVGLWVANAVMIDLGKNSPLEPALKTVETKTVQIVKLVWSKIKFAAVFVWKKLKQAAIYVWSKLKIAANFIKTKTVKLFKKDKVDRQDGTKPQIADDGSRLENDGDRQEQTISDGDK